MIQYDHLPIAFPILYSLDPSRKPLPLSLLPGNSRLVVEVCYYH